MHAPPLRPHKDETTEFKRQLTDALEKEVVAFLNFDKGGDIYIGVDDDDCDSRYRKTLLYKKTVFLRQEPISVWGQMFSN